MKNAILIVAIAISSQLLATNWYTCNNGAQFSTTLGGVCNISTININNATDTLFIANGHSCIVSSFNSITYGVIIIEGSLTLLASSKALTIKSGAEVIVKNGGSIVGSGNTSVINDGSLVVESGGSISTGTSNNATLTINGSGTATIDGTINTQHFVNDGAVTGTGTINAVKTVTGSGTLNGNTAGWQSGSATLVLSDVNTTWDGTTWSNSVPVASSIAIFDADYSTSADIISNHIIINSGNKVVVGNSDKFISSESIENNGTIELNSNSILWTNSFTGSGNVILKKTFNRVGWHHMSFPTKSGSCGDLIASNFSLSFSGASLNIYNWNATNSSWEGALASTSLVAKPVNIFIPNTSAILELNILNASLNFGILNQSLAYHVGGVTPGNAINWESVATDGWNFIGNTLPIYLDWELIAASLETTNFSNTAVYAWDGSSYVSFNTGGSSDARWIPPNQAFFVQTKAGANGSLAIDLSARTETPDAATNYFKTNKNVVINLNGQGFSLRTEIVEQPTATNKFDGKFDAYYIQPFGSAPDFNTVLKSDSMAYSLNQVPDLKNEEVFVSFSYHLNNKNFEISLDKSFGDGVKHVFLEDIYTGDVVDLKLDNYQFTSSNLAQKQRFKLHFNESFGFSEKSDVARVKMWTTNIGLLELESELNMDNAEVFVYDLNGRLVSSNLDEKDVYINKPGIYVVKVITSQGEIFNVKLIRSYN